MTTELHGLHSTRGTGVGSDPDARCLCVSVVMLAFASTARAFDPRLVPRQTKKDSPQRHKDTENSVRNEVTRPFPARHGPAGPGHLVAPPDVKQMARPSRAMTGSMAQINLFARWYKTSITGAASFIGRILQQISCSRTLLHRNECLAHIQTCEPLGFRLT